MNKIKPIFLLFIVLLNTSVFGQEKYITTSDSVKLFIKIKGKGIPCLFIHGGPGQGSNYWEKLCGDFSEKHYKMIYLDQRGCGRSSSPKNYNYNIDRFIKDFEEIRKSLNIKKWIIMGHSFGGVLQTYYAYKYPEKIIGMLMFNCTLNLKESIENGYIPSALKHFNIQNRSFFTNQSIKLLSRLDSIQKFYSTGKETWKITFSSLESAKKFQKTYLGIKKWNMDFSRYAFSNNDYMIDYFKLCPKINIPTLFLYSIDDNNVGKNYDKVKFPKVYFAKTHGGHMAFIDHKEKYLKAIEHFMNLFNIGQ